MKILVGHGKFNRVIFKDSGCDCQKLYFSICRPIFVVLNTNWEVSTILHWEILPSVNIIFTKKIDEKNFFFSKMRYFCTVKTVANQEKVISFSDSAPSDLLKKMFGASRQFQIFFCRAVKFMIVLHMLYWIKNYIFISFEIWINIF